ncbi:MAG: DUF177 domain-containing protein [Deltaproteobacteria bacterium]|nr:DUF177 domain-containing protein [Deltaproteobacteria bacterium]
MTDVLQFVANDIRLEGVEVDVRLDPSWLDGQLRDAGARAAPGAEEGARVVGRLSRSDDDIVVRCRVSAVIEADCVRCLEPARYVVKSELSLLLRPVVRPPVGARGAAHRHRGAAPAEEEYEFGADEAEVDTYDGEKVVLDGFVREAILLEMPNFPLCSEACAGIQAAPEPHERLETPAPVDPRLAPLGQFRKQLGGPTTLDELVAAAAERSAAMGRPVMRSNAHRVGKKK